MWNQVLKEAESKMKKTVEVTFQELTKIRTGRANPAILDAIVVQYYGAPTPLKQLATISTPDPRMIVVQPFDANSVPDVQKAIQSADLGLQPQVEGKILRIPVPALSKERREDLVKVVKKIAEDGRISIRSVRREANDQVKKLEKDKKITEDDRTKALDSIQKATDRSGHDLDDASANKEKELLNA